MAPTDDTPPPATWVALASAVPSELLKPNSAYFQLALEASGTGLWTWDLRTDAVNWSAECYRIHGVAPDEKPDRAIDFFELVHPADRQRVDQTVRQAVETRTLYECEFRIVRPTGEIVWVQNRGRAICNENGLPIRVIGTIIDISTKKRAAAAEHELEVLYRALAATLPGAAVFLVGPDLRYQVAGGEALSTVATKEDFHGRRVDEVVPEPFKSQAVADYSLALAGTPFLREHAAGGRHYLTRGAPLRDAQGRITGAIAVSCDISDRKKSEEALRVIRQQLDADAERVQLALEAGAIIGTWVWEVPANRFVADERFARTFGIEMHLCRDGLPIKQVMDSVHPEDVGMVQNAIAEVTAHGGAYRCAYRARRGDGQFYWIEASGRVELGPDGTALRFPGVLVDIEVRRRAEAERDAADALLRTFIEAAPAVVYAKDRDGRMLLANGGTAKLVGKPVDAIIGHTDLEFLDDKAQAATVMANDQRIMASGMREEIEEAVRLPDGTPAWWISSKAPLFDAQGAVVGLIGTSIDITQRRQAEQALRARERELQTLADNMPDIVARFDRQLRHVFINAAAERATGRPSGEFLGRTNRELGMPPQLCDRWDAAICTVFETNTPLTLEFDFKLADATRHYLSRMVPEQGLDGNVQYVMSIVSDITAQKEGELAQRDAAKRKDAFLAAVAHELRNPLAPIRNSVHLLQRLGDTIPHAARIVEVLDRQVAHLVRLVDDLMDAARIGQGKVDLQAHDLDLRTAIERAVDASRPLLDTARHELRLQLPAQPLVVNADPTRLAQVLVNLVNNAAKYTPPGGLIQVSATAQEQWAVIRVADNGVGIPAEMLSKVFELFEQVREHAPFFEGGLGIGLSLVRRLVEMHGGNVDVQSEGRDRGSTFTVRLPLSSTKAV